MREFKSKIQRQKSLLLGSLFIFLTMISIVSSDTFLETFEEYQYFNLSTYTLNFSGSPPRYDDSASENIISSNQFWTVGVSGYGCDNTLPNIDASGIYELENNITYGNMQLGSRTDFNQCHFYEWYLTRPMFVGQISTIEYGTYKSSNTGSPETCVLLVNTTAPYCLILERSGANEFVGWRNYCNTSGAINTWPYDECPILYDLAPASRTGEFVSQSPLTISSCPNYNGNESFDRIVISQVMSAGGYGVTQGIDNLVMDQINWVNTSNNLPDCEFNVTSDLICAEEGDYVELNIDCEDEEGDDILYSFENIGITRTRLFYYEDYVNLLSSGCSYDYSLFNKSNEYYSNVGGVFSDDDNNLVKRSYVAYPATTIYKNNLCDSALGLYISNAEYQFQFGQIMGFDSSTLSGLMFRTNNVSVLVTPFDEITGIALFNMTFDQEDGNLSITINDNVIYNREKELFIERGILGDFQNDINFRYVINNTINQTVFNFIIYDQENYDSTPEVTTLSYAINGTIESYSGINFNVSGVLSNINLYNYVMLKPIRVNGWNYEVSPEFISTYPNQTEITRNQQYLILYVTDDVNNLLDRYDTYTRLITVTDSKIICDGGYEGLRDPIVGTWRFMFRGLMTDLGVLEAWQDTFWYGYLIIFLGIWLLSFDFYIAIGFSTVIQLILGILYARMGDLALMVICFVGVVVISALGGKK